MSSDRENGTRVVAYGTEPLVVAAFIFVGMIDEISAAVRSYRTTTEPTRRDLRP